MESEYIEKMERLETILYMFRRFELGKFDSGSVLETNPLLEKEYERRYGYEVISIDKFKTKLLPGRFTIVSGVPASGKTAFCKMLSDSYMMCQGKIGLYELSHSGLFAQTDIMTYDEMGRYASSTDAASKNLKKIMKGCIGHWLIVSITPPGPGYDEIVCYVTRILDSRIYYAEAKIGSTKYIIKIPHEMGGH
jgi:hypothetical protein